MEGEMALGQIGQRLAQARMAKGLTLEQVQEITKIRIRYLEALEAEDWPALPGEVYLRGFLKTYAQLVGLDPVETLQLYQPAPPPIVESEPIPVPANRPGASVRRADRAAPRANSTLSGRYRPADRRFGSSSGKKRLPAVAVLVLLLGVVVYLGYRAWRLPAAVAPSPAPTGIGVGAPAAAPAPGSPGSSAQRQEATPVTAVPSAQLTKQSETPYEVRYIVKVAQGLALKVGIRDAAPGEAVGQCWIDVQSDERNVGDTMLRSGRTQEYSAKETIRLRVGNPQVPGLQLSVNGVEIPRPQTTEPLDLIFTRQTP
ncbi:MAG: helix-turn-helix domain-containing protein [Bacillota bacterium]